jgi:uncharacterized protein involved in outer membrane biogenesis
MRLKWIFGLGLFLVIALTATIYVVLSRYDYEHLKPQVAQQVKTATGRELTLAGPVKIHLGLRPALVAEDVSFQNAPWGSRPHMAKVKRLEIQLALIPLLSGTIDLKRLILIEPDIRIETNKAGESNLQFNAEKSPDGGDTPPKKPDAPSTALALIFDEVQVQKGRLTFSDQRSGRTHALSLDSIRLRARDRATVDLQVHGDYNGHRYQVTGSAGILASFMDSHMDSHEPWPVDLKARAGGTNVSVKGTFKNPLAGEGLKITVAGEGDSVPELLGLFEVAGIPEVGPFKVAGDFTNPGAKLTGENLDIQVGKKDLAQVRVTGSVDDLLALGGIDAFVKADGPSVPRVLEIFHVSDVPDVGPFQVSGNLTNPSGRFQVHNLNLVLGSDALKDLPRVRVTGSVDDVLALGGIDAFVKADGPSVPRVLEIFHVSDVPDVGPFQVSGNLTNPAGTFKADNLNLVLGTEALAEVRLAGSVEDLQGLLGMDLDFSARGSDLAGLEKIVGAPLFTKGPFQVQGHALIPSRTDYELSDFKISVSGSDLAGTARLSLNGKVPHLEAALSSKRLDLRFLFPQEDQKSAETVSKSKRVLPQTPFPLEPLGKLDAKLAMQAKRIELPSFILDDLTTRIDLDDRHLAVAPCSFVAGSGAVDARLDVRPDGTSTALELVLKADHLDLGHMLKELGVNDVLAGILALDVDVSGRGATVADVLGGLNGRTVLIMKEGWINDRIMGFLGSDLGSSLIGLLNPAREESTGTDIRCLVSGLDIKDGSAETTVLVVDTSQVSVVGYGKLDLKTEALDLSLKPTPKKGLGIKGLGKVSLSLGELTKPLKLRGTLADPALAVDPAGTFVAIGKTVGGVALFGPFGLAAALAGGQFGDADPCDAAIEAVRKPPSEAPSQETHDNNTKKTTGGVGAGLKKIFGK